MSNKSAGKMFFILAGKSILYDTKLRLLSTVRLTKLD